MFSKLGALDCSVKQALLATCGKNRKQHENLSKLTCVTRPICRSPRYLLKQHPCWKPACQRLQICPGTRALSADCHKESEQVKQQQQHPYASDQKPEIRKGEKGKRDHPQPNLHDACRFAFWPQVLVTPTKS